MVLPFWLAGDLAVASTIGDTDHAADNPQFLFIQALEEREAGDLSKAIQTFQTILQQHPNLHRARLELAVAYYQALNFAEARSQAEQVLNDPGTPENVKIRVQAFIERLDEAGKAHRWSPFVSFGFLNDSNVNAGPDQDRFILPGGAIAHVPRIVSRSDHGLDISGGIAHRYLAPETVRAFGSEAALLWFSRASGYLLRYSDEADRDLDVLSFRTGPVLIAARKWRLGASVLVDHVRLDRDGYLASVGINPSITWNLRDARSEITVDAMYQKRDYLQSNDSQRDSRYQNFGVAFRHAFRGDKIAAQVRVDVFDENADLRRYGNDGVRLSLNGSWQTTNRTSLYARAIFQDSQYDGVEPAFGVRRDDDQRRYILGVAHTFKQTPWLDGWTVDGSLAYTDKNSNIPIYDYDRTIFALRLNRSF